MNGGTRRAAPAHQTRPAAARSLRRALTSRHSRGAGGRDQRRREAPDAPSASAEPRPRPTGVAVQTRSRQPPPQRPSGGSAGTTASGAGPALSRLQLPPPAGAMGWEEKQVRGYSEFVQTAQRYHGRPIFALFCGDKDAEGKSWCPDCVTAEPVVRRELHNMPDESVFIYCLVGDRAYWKDPNNEFRKNLKLTGVPTLLKYGTPQKLVEEECFKAELVPFVSSHFNFGL
uniref:Thioredoxin domain-containing protein 17 n=1 Tax=Anas platyrhynchos TaxID=8839 RepID=A0A8B9T8E6_ANAPL